MQVGWRGDQVSCYTTEGGNGDVLLKDNVQLTGMYSMPVCANPTKLIFVMLKLVSAAK